MWPFGHILAADPRLVGGDKESVLPIKGRVLYRKRDRNLDLVFLFIFKALGSLLDSIEVVSLFYNL